MTEARVAELAARLDRVLDAFDARPTAPLRQALLSWIDVVDDFNRTIDLTAARDDDELVDLLVADAALLASHVPRDARVVDVGTGAGAPGLPLALLRSDLEVVLVEPLQKRVATLRTAIGRAVGELGAQAFRAPVVKRERGEDLARRGERFDVALSRATLSPIAWLDLGAQLAGQGSVWVLLADAEPPSLPGWIAIDDLGYRWPLTGRARRAVRFERGPVT